MNEKVVETFDQWAENGRDAGMEEGHGDVVRQVIASENDWAGECRATDECNNCEDRER